MIKKILDYLFPKYYVIYGYMFHNHWYKGEYGPYDSLTVAKMFADDENEFYGAGTHWVTDKNGNQV